MRKPNLNNPSPQDNVVKHCCSQCPMQYSSRSNLTRHVNSFHHEVKFKCDQCEKQFSAKPHLRQHIQVIHNGIRIQCNVCQKYFAKTSYMKEHKVNKHSTVRQTHKCDTCKAEFTLKCNLARHMKTFHNKLDI